MMFGALLVSTLVSQVTPPKITFDAGSFKVSGALGQDVVSLAPSKKKPSNINHAAGRFQITAEGKTVVFDAKGLTISMKGHSATSKMSGVPTSGKLATKESNEELMQLVVDKKRKLDVSALSGWEMIDKSLLLLCRWEDSDKKPWLEALMAVDLSEKRPQARLVARFDGISFAQGKVDDVMIRRADKLALLANKDGSFGVARLTTDGRKSDFERMGAAVGKAKFNADEASAWTLTPTKYGTNILGVVDLDQNFYHVVSEFRGKMIEVLPPAYARYQTQEGPRMVNLMTGADISIDGKSTQHETANGLLIWTPSAKPKYATLYDSSFRKLAGWMYVAPPVTAPVVAKPAPDKKAPVKPAKTGKKPTKAEAKKKPTEKKATPKVTKKPTNTTKPKTTAGKTKPTKKPKVEIEVTSRPSTKKRGG